MTACTYSCGHISVIRNNLLRLVVATVVWFSMTSFFEVIYIKVIMSRDFFPPVYFIMTALRQSQRITDCARTSFCCQ